MEIDSPEIHVLELDGFLNSLRCVFGHSSKVFGAGYLKKSGSNLGKIIESQIRIIKNSGLLVNKKIVDFEYIQHTLNNHVYSKLSIKDKNTLTNLDWNLIEYFGLISTAENENGKWNRLVSQKHVFLEYTKDDSLDSVMFFVEHDNFVIVTYL